MTEFAQPRDTELPQVAITLATYRRPDGLASILPELHYQAASVAERAQVEVIVIDNDPDGGARDLVAQHPDVRYVHEPTPGIAAARNAGLDAAGEADAVVFIDDDELPDEGWLATLVGAWLEWGCEGVWGPVEYVYENMPSQWVATSGMFARLTHETGADMTEAATNNLLLSLPFLRRHGLRFDTAFGLTGGSDLRITRALIAAGGRIRWCDEAVVSEVVPDSRATPEWVLTRTARSTNVSLRTDLDIAPTASARARIALDAAARGAYRMARGTIRERLAARAGRVSDASAAARDKARGLGQWQALTGYRRNEYRPADTASV